MKVRDITKLVQEDGWFLLRTKGSHRQFKHNSKKGLVTINGHPGDDVHPDVLSSIYRQSQIEKRSSRMHKYLIIIEHYGNNYSAYSPDVPGCIATGNTEEETEKNMRNALEFHLEGLRQEGLPIPVPVTRAQWVTVG